MTIQGIDTSSYQGVIDWGMVAASGRAFAVTRSGVGTTKIDTTAAVNLAGMRAHGMIPGAYHIVYPGVNQRLSAELMVSIVARALGSTDGVLMVVDAENIGNQPIYPTPIEVEVFARRIQELTGRKPIAYIPAWWMHQTGWPAGLLSDLPYWHSSYGKPGPPTTPPPPPPGWGECAFWQWTDAGIVAGVPTNVDLDTYFGDLASLRALAGIGAPPMPLDDTDRAWLTTTITGLLRQAIGERYNPGAVTPQELLQQWPGVRDQIRGGIDTTAIAAAVAAALPTGTGSITVTDVEDALKHVLAHGIDPVGA